MKDLIKKLAGRIAGAIAAAIVAWLGNLCVAGQCIVIGPDATQGLEGFLIALIAGAALLAYAVVHRLIDGWFE